MPMVGGVWPARRTRNGVLPLPRLSLRLPDGPEDAEPQVDTTGHPHASPLARQDGPRYPRLHLGKVCTTAGQGA